MSENAIYYVLSIPNVWGVGIFKIMKQGEGTEKRNLRFHVCCLCHQAGSVNVGAEGGHLLVILLQIVNCPLNSLTVIHTVMFM